MPHRWRISRAVLYGLLCGAIFSLLGQMNSPGVPAGFVYWAYVAGEWTGAPIIGAIVFAVVAAIRNLFVFLQTKSN
jgi:hypothetical protein